MSDTITLFSQPYLDSIHQCYKNIVTVNLLPKGPFAQRIGQVQFKPLSKFKCPGPCERVQKCGHAVISHHGQLMTVDEVPELIAYLTSHGYKVDTSLTKMFNASDISFDTNVGKKLICFVTYKPGG